MTSNPAGSTSARGLEPGTPVLSDDDRRELLERIEPLAAAFAGAGYRFFLVGGLVRDALLGHGLTGDIDITTDAKPDQIAVLAAGWADTVWDQGKRFGTIGARRGSTTVEITTHRAESYDSSSRKPHVRFSDDVATDLSRRDFTVNAMAIELPGWALLDPFDGLTDLADGVLRTPSPPEGLFADDPLRMLRAARFSAQLSLIATPELVAAVRSSRPRLAIVSRERIEAELTKLLELPRPSAGVRFLDDTGLLGDLLPPWRQAEAAVPAAVLDDVADLGDPVALRWAILLGPVCDEAAAARCLSALRCDNATRTKVAATLRAARALETAATRASADDAVWRKTARQLIADHEPELDAAAASLAAWGNELREPFAARLAELRATEGASLRRLPIDGHRVMKLLGTSGPAVGEALEWLRTQQIEHGPLDAEGACRLLTAWNQGRQH
ncbi:MAG: CCA tRNA nucleotidyltransferase [Acidimicrobiaceae bacterium]|nr:CCA tRNA nucleotidyltransferase [Acidimicrobiaceae bacterium]